MEEKKEDRNNKKTTAKDYIDNLFVALDIDKNGWLDKDELLKGVKRQSIKGAGSFAEQLRFAFKSLPGDSDEDNVNQLFAMIDKSDCASMPCPSDSNLWQTVTTRLRSTSCSPS